MTRNTQNRKQTNAPTYLRPVDPSAHFTDPYGHWDLHLMLKLGGQRLGHIIELSKVRLLMLLLVMIDSGMDQDPGVGDMVEELGGMEDRGPGAEIMHHRAGRDQLHAKRLE